MKNIDDAITEIFEKLKIKKNLKGYDYLFLAVKLRYENPTFKRKIYTVIYKKIAKQYGVNVHNVERNIRSVIESTWRYDYVDEHHLWYDEGNPDSRFRPMASKFIENTIAILEQNIENEDIEIVFDHEK